MFILNFSVILYSLLFYALFLFLGFGLTVLFCPKELRKYTIFLSPMIGYCLLTLAGWFFYSLNFKGTDDYYYWILLLSLILFIAAIMKIWKQKILATLFSRELIIPLLISIIVFVAIAFPALRQGELTCISLGNNDIASYTLISKAVKELPKNDVTNTIDFCVVQEQTFGGFINTAFFCSVMKVDPYQVQMVGIYVFFIISLLLTYILGREIFHYTSLASGIISLLYGLNSVLYYVMYNGFENQIIAVSLMLLIVLLNVAVIRTATFKNTLGYLPLLILSLWGLSLTYSHMIIIIYAVICCYALISILKNRGFRKLLNYTAINCIAFIVIFFLSPDRLQMVTANTFNMSNVNAGWFMPLITPQKLYGITSFIIPDTITLQLSRISDLQIFIGVTIIVSIFLIAVIVSGFIKLFKNDKENFLFSSTMFLLIFTGALILSLLNISKTVNSGFGGYNQFKLISFFLPLLLLSSFALFRDMSFNIRNFDIRSRLQQSLKTSREYISIKRNTLLFLILGVLLITNCLSAGVTLYAIIKYAEVIAPDTINLQSIRQNKEIKSINIPADVSPGAYWNIMWEAYFLAPKKLYFEQQTYYAATPLNGEWSLIRNTKKILSISSQDNPGTIPINSTYSLTKNVPTFTARFGEGWSDDQITHRWTTSDVASIIIDSPSEKAHTNLTLEYHPLKKENSLAIYINGSKIMDCDNNSNCLIKDLLLNKGENTIEFKAKLPAEQPGNGDPRKLCYSFESIKFEEIK